MKKTSLIIAFALALTLAAVQLSRAEDTPRKDAAPVLKSVSCPPECGFMCRSHDEKELIEIVKAHAMSAHGKVLTDEQIRSFMQSEAAPVTGKKT